MTLLGSDFGVHSSSRSSSPTFEFTLSTWDRTHQRPGSHRLRDEKLRSVARRPGPPRCTCAAKGERNDHQRILAIGTEIPDVPVRYRNQFLNILHLLLQLISKDIEHGLGTVDAVNGNPWRAMGSKMRLYRKLVRAPARPGFRQVNVKLQVFEVFFCGIGVVIVFCPRPGGNLRSWSFDPRSLRSAGVCVRFSHDARRGVSRRVMWRDLSWALLENHSA